MKLAASVSLLALALAGCATAPAEPGVVAVVDPVAAPPAAAETSPAPTAAMADAFVMRAEQDLATLSVLSGRAQWVNATYITRETDAIAAKFDADFTAALVRYATEASQYQDVPDLSAETRRKLYILRIGISNAAGLAAPSDPALASQLADLKAKLQSSYGKGRATLDGKPITGDVAEEQMGKLRDPRRLTEVWSSWHNNVGRPMRGDYARMVEIANQGAKELGFNDTGAMWRAGYDMSPEEFSALYDKLWGEVKPLYDQLHCYTRAKLSQKYGASVQAESGPIRSDLLGNMWAQSWGNVYDIVAPKGAGDIGYDLTKLLVGKKYTPEQMVRSGERFYTSLGLAPLPQTFWERSQIVRPEGREVVCHASAWNLDNKDDLRIKMCTKVNADDFVTIHHELGHNYYQRAYNQQPYLYLNGANDGFHEAIGDFIALSVTPEYLVQIGLLDRAKVPSADKDVGLLMNQAMDKVAFLPFGLLVDKWRWGVFDGSIPTGGYEQGWNALRLQYQGITPPVARTEADFDPGAKFHIPGNTPYARYFLAAILQFQLYKSACDMAGWSGPLHRCSFYGNKQVGERLDATLKIGASKPWPDALQAFTGTREMSARPMLEYFAPLQNWLQQQNAGRQCSW